MKRAKREFGSFLKSCAEHLDDPQGMAPFEMPLDSELTRIAFDRAVAPRKAKEALEAAQSAQLANAALKEEIEVLKQEINALNSRRGRSRREKPLRGFVRAVKSGMPDATQLKIAARVDSLLAREKTSLRSVCPTLWFKRYSVPRLLAEALGATADPRLKATVKSYISKA